jgi:hypothetical protein
MVIGTLSVLIFALVLALIFLLDFVKDIQKEHEKRMDELEALLVDVLTDMENGGLVYEDGEVPRVRSRDTIHRNP